MSTFFVSLRHSPQACALFNREIRKAVLDSQPRLAQLLRKYQVESIGMWSVCPEHLVYWVCKSLSHRSLVDFFVESEMASEAVIEIKEITPMEEVMGMLKNRP